MHISAPLQAFLKENDINPKTELWDCHGTPVIKHKALEVVAARKGIKFDPPTIITTDIQDGIAIMVTGFLGKESVWTIGEAHPKNNKTQYPWAMAEKRAKDRLILKLCKIHAYVYSEDEADDFKKARPGNYQASAADERPIQAKKSAYAARKDGTYEQLEAEIRAFEDSDKLADWFFSAETQKKYNPCPRRGSNT